MKFRYLIIDLEGWVDPVGTADTKQAILYAEAEHCIVIDSYTDSWFEPGSSVAGLYIEAAKVLEASP